MTQIYSVFETKSCMCVFHKKIVFLTRKLEHCANWFEHDAIESSKIRPLFIGSYKISRMHDLYILNLEGQVYFITEILATISSNGRDQGPRSACFYLCCIL